jgi:hypothetical protein
VRTRYYEAVSGIGSASREAELEAEQRSEERRCPYLSQCPLHVEAGER